MQSFCAHADRALLREIMEIRKTKTQKSEEEKKQESKTKQNQKNGCVLLLLFFL